MGQLDVRLLGRPTVVIDGVAAPPPRGAKAWALLAYLAAADRAHTRSELAELLFGEADDPLGALRWNLAALRRLLDLPDGLKGDEILLDLPPTATIDARQVDQGSASALDQPGLGRELLAGLSFSTSPAFETWLLTQRRRLAAQSASLVREAALSCLARGDHDAAIRWATDLVGMDTLDEGHHALLIRAHALAGDAPAAQGQLDRCRAVLRAELGCEPGTAVLAAAHFAAGAAGVGDVGTPEVVGARLSVAWQSFLGGAIDHALDVGRAAMAMADSGGDEGARILTRTYLGSMLGMAVRGWDEGATALMGAIHLAEQHGRPAEQAYALGVLAGIDMMRADYDAAAGHVRSGLALSDHPGPRSLNLTFLAAIEADRGRFDEAAEAAREAVASASAAADPVVHVYAQAHAGRVFLMRDEPDEARVLIDQALAASGSMLAVRPWVMAMRAEVDLADGDVDRALRHAEAAAALADTTKVTYQQALAARALGLSEAARDRPDAAVDRLTEALALARRSTGEGYTFHWPVTFVLDSLSAVTRTTDPVAARRWATALLEHASTIGMDDFTARARCYLAEGNGA